MSKTTKWFGAVGLAAVLAGCGSSGSTSSSGSNSSGSNGVSGVGAVQAAYHSALQAKTAQISMNLTAGNTGSNGQTVDITATGAVDFANNSTQLALNIPQLGSLQEIVTGGALYMELPQSLSSQLGASSGKPWIKIDLKQLAQAGGSSLSSFGGGSSNPASFLSSLAGVTDNGVTNVGTDVIRGVQTTHYRADVDLNKALAKLGGDSASGLQSLQASLGTTKLPVDLWLDSQGLPRRMQIRFSVPSSSGSSASGSSGLPGGSVDLTIDIFNYGQPVSIAPPPPDQVSSGSGLSQLGSLGGGSSSSGASGSSPSPT